MMNAVSDLFNETDKVVNSVTDLFTHGTGRKRDESHAFWQSHFGRAEKIKNEVLADMLALAV
jgi:hypothetical protein